MVRVALVCSTGNRPTFTLSTGSAIPARHCVYSLSDERWVIPCVEEPWLWKAISVEVGHVHKFRELFAELILEDSTSAMPESQRCNLAVGCVCTDRWVLNGDFLL